MAFIEDIVVQVIPGAPSVARLGFGIPLLVGNTGQRSVYIHGSGVSGLVVKSTPRNHVVSVEIQVGAVYAYAFASGVVTIDIPAGSLVRELVSDFNANASAPIKAEISVQALTTGSGVLGILAETPLVFTAYRKIVSISQLNYYYDSTDTEYKMLSNMLASKPSPVEIYLLDIFGSADITADLTANDTGSWDEIPTNSTIAAIHKEFADIDYGRS